MINFSEDRWKRIEEVYGKWWARRLERPLMGVVVVKDKYPIEPKMPPVSQANITDLSITPEQIVDRFEAELSRFEFYGDAYPNINMDMFGPGVLAAFLGADVDSSTGRIWFHPHEHRELGEYEFHLDENNIWWNRLREIYRIAKERFGESVIMGMTDLGGVMDVLSTFRPGEELLFDLIDCPEDVHRQHRAVTELWMRAYEMLGRKDARGYTDWSSLFSKERSYIIQCDFAYMIGNDMFEEFVSEDLRDMCKRIPHTIYHLDGVGEIKHLDSLLGIPELDAVQWIPGDGAPTGEHWMDIYERIIAAGKGVQIAAYDFNILKEIVGKISNPGAVNRSLFYVSERDKDEALAFLDWMKVER